MSEPLSIAVRQSLWRYAQSLDRDTLRKAQLYASNGRVLSTQLRSGEIVGRVRGQSDYSTALRRESDGWLGTCSCPMAEDCKHCGALALAVLNPTKLAAAGPLAPRKKASFREEWAPQIAEKLGRALTSDELHALGQLSALFSDFTAAWHRLHSSALQQRGFNMPVLEHLRGHGYVYDGWWSQQGPPRDPWALWQYLAVDLELAGRPVPEVFRPMTNTAALRAQIGERLTALEMERWRQAFARPAPSPFAPKPRPKLAGLRLRFDPATGWHLEMQAVPGKPFKPVAKSWLRGLAGAGQLHEFASLPPAQAALGALLLAETTTSSALEEGDISAVIGAAVALSIAHEAIELPDGGPWRLAEGELNWHAAVLPGTSSRVTFQLAGPAGEPAEDARLILRVDETTFYLWHGRVHRGPPPLPAPTAPLRLLENAETRSLLRQRGVRLPVTFEAKIRRIALRPRLECRLDGPVGADRNQLCVRLLAVAEDPPCAQERAGHGWQWAKAGAPPPRRVADPFVEFDLAAADALVPRLTEFKLGWFAYYNAWMRWHTRNFAEEFAAWLGALPRDVEIVLAPELAGFALPPVRAALELKTQPAADAHDWFDLQVALRVEDTSLTAEEIALLLKARGKWVQLPGRGYRRLELATGGPARETLERLGLAPGELAPGGKPASHRLHALQLAGEADALGDAKLAAALRARAAALTRIEAPVPAALTATLRPYQREGFEFLAFLAANRLGGVLADDMGLGKTVQTLAWLLWLAECDRPAPGPKKRPAPFRALVVCPKSVVHGWLAETARFAPTLAATAFTPALAAEKNVPAGLVLANYTQLRLHAEWFQTQAWDAAVLDEGQFIKNPASQIAAAARGLRAAHRAVLTGTPIENRLADLWSLFAFAQPGLLGGVTEFRRQHPQDDPAALARLRRRTRHFLLRRTKAQVAPDLPPRTEDELSVELEPAQRKLYDAELKRARAQLLGIETDRALDQVRFNILASLLRLRQICCHPALVDPAHAELPSAKLDALLERLEELGDEGHQVLVFSQFVEMLELIRARLAAAGIGHLLLTGATEDRGALVEEFQRDSTKTVFLLSLKAAGFGLNLTAASYAILYDPWWNPAVEAQAIDRTHRIGQTKPVIAYRLIARDTVEEKIRALQKEKATLAQAVVQEESLASVLDLESLRKILA